MPDRLVVLVAGPPGSGKSTRARELASAHGLIIYDRDDPRWTGDRAFRQELEALGADDHARAVVVRTCPTRSSWRVTVAQVRADRTELLAPDVATCCERISHDRAHPRPRAGRMAGVSAWWQAHRESPWSPADQGRVLPPSREW